eukprot:3612931-Rhodomonas_salina.1
MVQELLLSAPAPYSVCTARSVPGAPFVPRVLSTAYQVCTARSVPRTRHLPQRMVYGPVWSSMVYGLQPMV